MIKDDGMIMFSKINLEYFKLAKDFRNFVLNYNVSHEHMAESIFNDIIKRTIEYILHRRQSDYDTDCDESESEDEEASDENLIDNTLKQQIDDISQEKSISNSLKQLLIDNLLKQSAINKILKDSSINNKESMINNILN